MPRVLEILGAEGLIERPGETAEGSPATSPRATRLSGRPRSAPAGPGAWRRGVSPGARLFDAARLWPHPSLCRRDPDGAVTVFFTPEELGFEIAVGTITVTECEMVNQFIGSANTPPQFTRGYGLVFGQLERKAMSMALVDRALRADEFGEERTAPAQDEEFVLSHADNVQATGFVEHLKLPHYVDFQAELELLRRLRAERERDGGAGRTRREAQLQFRLSQRADQADDPPGDPQGGGDPRLPGAVCQPRDADALWLGDRRRPGHRQRAQAGRRAEGDRPGGRRHHQCGEIREFFAQAPGSRRPRTPPRRR